MREEGREMNGVDGRGDGGEREKGREDK